MFLADKMPLSVDRILAQFHSAKMPKSKMTALKNKELHSKRGMNRQQSISYLGIKGTYFDLEIRPKLHEIKMGTCVIFDKIELDAVFDQIMLTGGDVGPTEKGIASWPKEPQVSLKQKTGVGELTRPTKALDFKDALKRIKQRKPGC